MAIRELLTAKTASERSAIKSVEIPKLVTTGEYVHTAHGITAELQGAVAIPGGISVLARAKTTANGKPIGFGDGSVEWERFRIYNPPIMVPDGTKRTVTPADGRPPYEVDNYKEDAIAALREVVAHNVKLTGKPGAGVVPGKIGSTVSTFYPDADIETTSVDGISTMDGELTWADAHDAVTGDSASSTGATANFCRSQGAGGQFFIDRGFFLFDTSSIPDADVISAAILSLYVNSTSDGDNDGDDWIGIFTTTPATNTDIITADYDQIGTVLQAPSIDIGSVTTAAYNDFTLNATGRGNVSKTGVSKFGTREGHDALNSAITAATNNSVSGVMADTAGTTQDPKLVVTHAVAVYKMFLVL